MNYLGRMKILVTLNIRGSKIRAHLLNSTDSSVPLRHLIVTNLEFGAYGMDLTNHHLIESSVSLLKVPK